MPKKPKTKNTRIDPVLTNTPIGGPYICRGLIDTKPPKAALEYRSVPEQGSDDWEVEERFKDWGKPLVKTGDDFTDWALQVRKEKLDIEIRELFMKELYGK